ncbi:hypothetical protein MMC18_004190 [Xylographa bjoerkii]|nr:hypothetical protein [Xylographa bjoerkii]
MAHSSSGEITSFLESMASAAQNLSTDQPGAREKLLSQAYELVSKLETPSECIQRMGWAEPARFAATQLAVDLKIFEKLKEVEEKGVSISELESTTKADAPLLARTMKHLASMNIVSEKGADMFASTPLSNAFTEPKFRDGITYCQSSAPLRASFSRQYHSFNVAGPSFHGLPAYLKATAYKQPHDISDGPFQYAHDTKLPFFLWLGEHPQYLENFNNYMAGYRAGKVSWTQEGFYPVTELLGASLKTDDDAVLLVDVGGGMGHDLEDFKARFPNLKGRLLLQERPEVISQMAKLSPGIEVTEHDFFTTQPVQGARAYYLHSVLHDWDDASSRRILTHLANAMERGYSTLLINELVVPDKGAAWSVTSMDWLMLALGAVRERTESDWRQLLESVGLKIVKIWMWEQGTESLIEAELV